MLEICADPGTRDVHRSIQFRRRILKNRITIQDLNLNFGRLAAVLVATIANAGQEFNRAFSIENGVRSSACERSRA